MFFVYYDDTALACECFHDFVAHTVAYMIGVFFHSGVFRLFLFLKLTADVCTPYHVCFVVGFWYVLLAVMYVIYWMYVCMCFAFTLCCTSFAHAAFSCFC